MHTVNQLLLSLVLATIANTTLAEPLIDPTMPAHYKAASGVRADSVVVDSIAPSWILNSTLISPQHKIAIINNRQLIVGEEIDGAVIKEISHQNVKLQYQEQLITLDLHRSFISKMKSK
ncbi:hypothetical protein A9Q92_07735 [Methylophaga sp. 42_8_T64]|nr:hypothetical protein A9Q78_08010 [Methylophaga sp. 41_12_T18]OUR85611.1 hypothetical protein A9Q92_07735 [Methylophaga sp. 42_8_T64]